MENRLSYYDVVAILIPGVILTTLLALLFGEQVEEGLGRVEGDFLEILSTLSIFTALSYFAGETLYILGEQLEKILRMTGTFYSETDIVRLHGKQRTLPEEVIMSFRDKALKDCSINDAPKDTKDWSNSEYKALTKYILTYGKLQARTYKNNRLDLFQSLAHFSRNLAALSFLMTILLPIILASTSTGVEQDRSWLQLVDSVLVVFIPSLPLILFLSLILLARMDSKPPIADSTKRSRKQHVITLASSLAMLLYCGLRESTGTFCTFLFIVILVVISLIAILPWKRVQSDTIELPQCLMLLLYSSFLSSSWLIQGSDYKIPYLFISIFLVHIFLIVNFTETFNRYFLELFCCINQSLSDNSRAPLDQRDSK